MALIGNEIQELLGDKKWVAMPEEDYKAICDKLRQKTSTSAVIVSGELAKKIASLAGVDVSMVTATADDVLSGAKFVNAAGQTITGTMANNAATATTLTTKAQTYTIPKGYQKGTSTVRPSTTNLSANNIKSGINILGVNGSVASGAVIYQNY